MVNPSVVFGACFCVCIDDGGQSVGGALERVQIFSFVEGLKIEFLGHFSSRGSSLMQSIAENLCTL